MVMTWHKWSDDNKERNEKKAIELEKGNGCADGGAREKARTKNSTGRGGLSGRREDREEKISPIAPLREIENTAV